MRNIKKSLHVFLNLELYEITYPSWMGTKEARINMHFKLVGISNKPKNSPFLHKMERAIVLEQKNAVNSLNPLKTIYRHFPSEVHWFTLK